MSNSPLNPALELHIEGPGYKGTHSLADGAPELVLGRDAVCDVCLPDPGKTISRRHLAVFNKEGVLVFRVLSVVNGVNLPGGEIPPGARALLPVGQTLQLGDYKLKVTESLPSPLLTAPEAISTPVREPRSVPDDDPWSVFEDSVSPTQPGLPQASPAHNPQLAAQAFAAFLAEDDPFSDSVFEPEALAQAPMQMPIPPKPLARGAMTGDMKAFYLGLGLDPAQLGKLSAGELEAAGGMVRRCIEGLLALQMAQSDLRQDLKTDERTMMASRDTNPLNADWPLEAKLQYLLAGRAWSVGFMSPDAALDDSLNGLRVHEQAGVFAARAVLEGTLREFAPEALKTRLLEGRASLGFLDSARLWEIYSQHYAEKSRNPGDWVQQLFERYFPGSYLRETQRMQRKRGKSRK